MSFEALKTFKSIENIITRANLPPASFLLSYILILIIIVDIINGIRLVPV